MAFTEAKWTKLLKWGVTDSTVDVLHVRLESIFQYWGDKMPVPKGKLYSFSTKRAVENFQRRVYIKITGEVDQYTWDYLDWALKCYTDYEVKQMMK